MRFHRRSSEAFDDALLEDDPVALYERAPCGYLSTTPSGLVTKANATFLAWVGHPVSEVVGRPLLDLLTRGGQIYYETHYMPMLLVLGKVQEVSVVLRRGDGSRLPVLLNAVLDRDGTGRPQVVRIAVFDATERRRYERELMAAKEAAEAAQERTKALARTLQQSLVPPAMPTVPGLEVAAAYHPAGDGSQVGGDFYDCFRVGPTDWFVVLGDVCGKGVEAAVVTALARYTLRGLAAVLDQPADLLHQLNDVLFAHESDRFCTLVLARLRREGDTWRATVATAGHPPALLVQEGAPTVELGLHGPIVGAFEHAAYEQEDVVLGSGQVLLLYTDGVTEARGGDDYYGELRLAEATARFAAGPSALVAGLVEEVLDFQAGVARDDIAVLALGPA